jgi:glutaredoxin 3
MTEVIIYTKKICPYCVNAKAFLARKQLNNIKEIDIEGNESLRDEMVAKAGGRRTVPQIFVNGHHIGGYDDMVALDQAGKFDELCK